MWKQLLMNAEFPLLRRELTQSAGRRRTWVLRVVVLVLLIFVMLSWYSSLVQGALSMGRGSLSFLGTGSQLLAGLVMFDLWAMLLLLPAARRVRRSRVSVSGRHWVWCWYRG